MSESEEFQLTFEQLKHILTHYSRFMDCEIDTIDQFYLNTSHQMNNKKPLYFGSVKINKNYVSYHLMPVYVNPGLLMDISPELKKRMQGKSCFNFKTISVELVQELSKLTESGYKDYQRAGYIAQT